MSLNVGSRLGHYDVTALIGEGGMGQVYQATDTKRKRRVALKILPEAFAADPERLARFQREAEVLASLNHPNIAQIHGLSSRPPSPTTWISEELQKCSPPSRTGVSRLPTSGGSSDRWCRGVGLLLCNPKMRRVP